MEIDNFEVKTYGWQEIACLYSPELKPVSAAKRLKRWLAANPNLVNDLTSAGWEKGKRLLTPTQVKIIVHYLGEP